MTQQLALAPLERSFYEPSARLVAPALLGHWLIRNLPDGPCGGTIIETEAYLVGDPASHGAPGPTARNKVMFGAPGFSYVYLVYGYHYCFNTVCKPAGIAEAVLIRALEPVFGESSMRLRRHVARLCELTNGPAKLCQSMSIDRRLDGVDLCNAASQLFIARNPGLSRDRKKLGPIVTTTRIGLTKAADLPLRFYLNGSSCVSRKIKNGS